MLNHDMARYVELQRAMGFKFRVQHALLRGGFHNSLATRPATRKMHAAWSSDWMMKPRRS